MEILGGFQLCTHIPSVTAITRAAVIRLTVKKKKKEIKADGV